MHSDIQYAKWEAKSVNIMYNTVYSIDENKYLTYISVYTIKIYVYIYIISIQHIIIITEYTYENTVSTN